MLIIHKTNILGHTRHKGAKLPSFPGMFCEQRTLTKHHQLRPLWKRWNSLVAVHVMFGCMGEKKGGRQNEVMNIEIMGRKVQTQNGTSVVNIARA